MVKRARKPPRKAPRRPIENADTPGFAARNIAAQALFGVLHRRRSLDEVLDSSAGIDGLSALTDRDRALVRMLVATTLRRLGTLRALLAGMLEAGLPKDTPQVEIALLLGATQILFLDVPDHAAVDLSVRLAAATRNRRYAGLTNAILRRVAREGKERLATLDPALDAPAWLLDRWRGTYGVEIAAAIAAAHRNEPALDLTAKSDAEGWAQRLEGRLLPNGTIRLTNAGTITDLAGFSEGAWWVQDFAASLPARLLGDIAGLNVADLCAAPGGKTAQLASAGAIVTAVDRSENRLKRLRENLARLGLNAETVVADATAWEGGPFDAVLLDAPCSATGTIRRHPELPWQKQATDIVAPAALQARLLERAATLVKPGGLLVYATCSLEPEEGEQQIETFLTGHGNYARVPASVADVDGFETLISPAGDLRTLPCHLPDPDPRMAGCDGFFAARLRRNS